MIPFFKKYPWLTVFVLLAITQLGWLWIAPENFKMTWSRNPLVAHIIKEHNSIEEKSKFLTLSYYATSLSYFADIITGSEEPDKDRTGGAIYAYYQMAENLLPNIDSVHYLLGYCEYYRGDIDEARTQYERSIDLDFLHGSTQAPIQSPSVHVNHCTDSVQGPVDRNEDGHGLCRQSDGL
jgi:tetratricopeptide (TPR) repeat protein